MTNKENVSNKKGSHQKKITPSKAAPPIGLFISLNNGNEIKMNNKINETKKRTKPNTNTIQTTNSQKHQEKKSKPISLNKSETTVQGRVVTTGFKRHSTTHRT